MKSIFRSGRRRPHQHHEEAQQDNATPFFDKKGDRPRSSPFFSQGGATVQAKLAIGQPGDRYEQEADAVADSVVQNQGRGAAPAIQGKGISRIQRVLTAADSDAATADERMEEDKMVQEKPEVQREAAVAEAMAGEEEEPVQMQHDPLSPRLQRAMEEDVQMKAEAGGSTAGPQLSNRIKNSAGKGRPLPGKARAEMEQSFGTDFSGVNIHTDTEAMQMNKELGAQAFTHGQDVYFNAGKFSPEHTEGKRLLAHELTHVVQQGGGIRKKSNETEKNASKPKYPNDFIFYTGGFNGFLGIVQNGQIVYQTTAISGHPGFSEHEKNVGPIPQGKYWVSPNIKRPEVKRPQNGVGGVSGIGSGYQEISSFDLVECDIHSHYCTETCGSQSGTCFTPVGVWGSKRLAIEGRIQVISPDGKKIYRDGFYFHGGHHSVNVTSGCIKVSDSAFFDQVRIHFKSRTPLFVDSQLTSRAILHYFPKVINQFFGYTEY
ncbi:MAG TPA: DUF4157 domain-containing protein [Saprospiraceae bacterium]|nr:DUF4157 domain-containing protein [Saprospiraceae bacterium]